MQVKAKKRKSITATPSRVHVDYERIIAESIKAIPEPIKGDKGEQGESIQGLKGEAGDSIRGAQGIKGEKGDSIQGAKGEYGKKGTQGDKGLQGNRGKEGPKGKESVVDYNKIFTSLKRELSKDRTLADISIKKKGGGTLLITKLYKDGRKTEDRITLQTGGGTGSITETWQYEEFILDAADITNGFITLSKQPITGSEFLFLNGVFKSPVCDYTIAGKVITWTTEQPRIGFTFMVKYKTQ